MKMFCARLAYSDPIQTSDTRKRYKKWQSIYLCAAFLGGLWGYYSYLLIVTSLIHKNTGVILFI
jgi:hypothetical protein